MPNIKLSLAELTECYIKAHNLPADTTFDVEPSTRVSAADMEKAFRDIESLNYDGHQKIAAIKRLRELIPGFGLAEAKTAIENWQTFKRDSIRLERYPRLGEGGRWI